jgi:pimeloyl-ACP methyl ester carboxylesterase
MVPLADAIQHLPNATNWRFYTLTYETHLDTFVQAAADLLPQMQALAKPLIVLGYSEGAIVARQLIADGLAVQALVTICGPHLGLGYWIPTPDLASDSVSPFSLVLMQLNQSPQEQRHRGTYHLFAITCSDMFGYHADDGVVPASSGQGIGLGHVAERATIYLDYGSDQIAGWDPHLRGMDPTHLRPVLTTCQNLLAPVVASA